MRTTAEALAAPTARCRDVRSGLTLEAVHVPVGDGHILTRIHQPDIPHSEAFVICSSLWSELATNQRRERILAERLARAGYPVARFAYRGTGDALDGSEQAPTVNSMCTDIAAATALVKSRGATVVSYVGFRAGALAAARTAATGPGRLVLWDPVFNGAKFLTELTRAARIAAMRGADFAADAPTETGEILGHSVGPHTTASLSAASIDDVGHPRSVLLIQVDPAAALRPTLAGAAEAWRRQGHDVSTVQIRKRRDTWFITDESPSAEAEKDTEEVVAATVRWATADAA